MKKIFILLLLVVIAYLFYTGRLGASSKIKVTHKDENHVLIAAGKHRLTAQKEFRDTNSFLLVGRSAVSSMHYTAIVSGIPIEQADELLCRYGNFMRCKSPGAGVAQRSVQHLALIPAEPGVERKILHTVNHGARYPVVQLTASKLNITRHIYKEGSEEVPIPRGGSQEAHYLVNDIEITQEDYMDNLT